ncbi:hypothetical protein [Marinibacterium sp. SX1]|uniref:hypothetical protein n=1 Tax=Marinibacterium sp. SX1 TaxID=3388424 RepID=UPI003D16A9E8
MRNHQTRGRRAALTIVTLAAMAALSGPALASDAATIQQSSSEMPVGIYATGSSVNYCPSGLQPVSVDGTTSCGTPNQQVTYAQAKQTPYRRSYGNSYSCAVGAKGCY